VYSWRLEQLGEDRAACSSEMVAAHWLDEPRAEASASKSSGAVLESSVVAYGMKDTVHV
jgi:hypothetical protein